MLAFLPQLDRMLITRFIQDILAMACARNNSHHCAVSILVLSYYPPSTITAVGTFVVVSKRCISFLLTLLAIISNDNNNGPRIITNDIVFVLT
jgi:hypothetical protein